MKPLKRIGDLKPGEWSDGIQRATRTDADERIEFASNLWFSDNPDERITESTMEDIDNHFWTAGIRTQMLIDDVFGCFIHECSYCWPW